jgi:predicted O-methyltransferase YrrM
MIKALYKFLSPKFQKVYLEYKVDVSPRYGHGKPAHPELLAITQKQDETYASYLKAVAKYQENLWQIKDSKLEQDPKNPAWNNSFLPGLDMVMLYTLISELKPKKYVEIGSGNSTKIAFKAKKEQNLSTKFISIDPQPRAEIDALVDEVIRKPFEAIDFKMLEELEENDILFVDNSHRILPNSDATVFFLEVLHRLKKGVVVHIHDIYIPYDYPQFMCDRFYSEQYGLAMYLLANSEKYQPLFANYYVSEKKELATIIADFWKHENTKNVEKHGGSFWLRIN